MNFLIDLGVKATVALGVAFSIAFALRRGSASVRYAMWTCVLAAILVLPVASLIGPGWNVAIDRGVGQVEQVSTSVVVHAGRPASAPAPPWIMIGWVVGAIAILARMVAGHWRVRSLFGSAEEIRDARWSALSAEVARSIGLRRRIVLKRSTATDVPLSYGIFRATVLLPGDSDSWTDDRRRVVLSHEMIHARRLDSLWGVLAQGALAVNWFHPLAWLAAKQFRKEQERSCDDAVVAAGTASTVYAAHLVDLARSIAIPEPALGMAERFDLEGRIHSLLDPARRRTAVSRRLSVAMFIGALALIVPLAAVRAQVGKASIGGTVYDPSGAIVPGATISLSSTGGSNEEFARANAAGVYKLQVPAGGYLVKVTVPGFAMYQSKIVLESGVPATVNVNLSLGEVRETLEIVGKGPQSAAASTASPQKIRVGGNVQHIKLISKVDPAYPADAQAEGVEGTVVLRAVVSKDGRLLGIRVVSGADPRLATAAINAVQLWQYQPALLNGMPVEVITTIALAFRLN